MKIFHNWSMEERLNSRRRTNWLQCERIKEEVNVAEIMEIFHNWSMEESIFGIEKGESSWKLLILTFTRVVFKNNSHSREQ